MGFWQKATNKARARVRIFCCYHKDLDFKVPDIGAQHRYFPVKEFSLTARTFGRCSLPPTAQILGKLMVWAVAGLSWWGEACDKPFRAV